MTVTVRQLIEEQAAGLIGREDERAILHQLLREGCRLVDGSNVIEVAVGSIRRKLGDRSSAVETVRGMGYRFIQE
jgi:DNA-binding response OmpR family regulator